MILSAVYMLWMFQRVNYGPVTNEKNAACPISSRASGPLMVPTSRWPILMGVLPTCS